MTVVFFFPNVLRDSHRYVFGLDQLIADGWNIILLDARKFYRKAVTGNDEFINKYKYKITCHADFLLFKDLLPDGPVVYVSFDQHLRFSKPIFKLLIRKNDVLLSYHTKRFSTINERTGRIRVFFDSVLKKIDKLIPIHFFSFFYKNIYDLYISDYYLCSTKYLIPTKVYLTIKKRNRIVVHSDDLNHILSSKEKILDQKKKTAVFLDQGIPFLPDTHPAIYPNPFPEGYFDEYYEKLANSFVQLKEELQLDEIVIALHPDAVKFKNRLEGKFSGFKTYIGNTNELIRDSNFVFGHCSTSIGIAVFYKKPVLILTDKVLMNYHLRLMQAINFFIENLGMEEVNMDKTIESQGIQATLNDLKYHNYTIKFLKDNTIQQNSFYYSLNKIKEDIQQN